MNRSNWKGSDRKRKMAALREAQALVEQAIAKLDEAQATADNWGDFESIVYFQGELQQFLSSDHGDAGFSAYVRRTGSRR